MSTNANGSGSDSQLLVAAIHARGCLQQLDYLLHRRFAEAKTERDAALDLQLHLALLRLDEIIEQLRNRPADSQSAALN